MKKIICTLLGLVMAWQIQACDVCGSGGSNSLGILPQFRKHFIGVRYNYQNFKVTHPSYLSGIEYPPSDQTFQSFDLWGRFYPTDKLQLFAFVPYRYTNFADQSNKQLALHGLGDIVLMGNYLLFETAEDSTRSLRHMLWAGGGLKLPTGSTDARVEGAFLNPNLQPGTGAFEFLLSSVYTVRYKQAGVNAEAMYRIPTASGDARYRIGNRLSSSLKAFYWQDIGAASFLPQVGLAWDKMWKDTRNGTVQDLSGGYILSGHIGLDVYLDRFLIGASYRMPLKQDLSIGYTEAIHNISTNIVYFIK